MRQSSKKKAAQGIAFTFLWIAALITVGVMLFIVGYILIQGVPHITWEFLSTAPKGNGSEGGIFPMIINTLILVFCSLIVAIPIGVLAAVFLTEYAKQGRIVKFIRSTTENLAGIPSIIFGLFGWTFFGKILGMKWSMLNGALTAMIVVLPTIIRTAEEAIMAVPQSYREGSLGIGATKWQTTLRVVIPTAAPGILTGIVLSVGRIVGETAALLFTLGTVDRMVTSLMDSGETLSLRLYTLAREGISVNMAWATAAVLVFLVLILNLGAAYFVRRMNRKRNMNGR